MQENKLMALNNHLFEQMERINDDDLTDEQLKKETARTKQMVDISAKIIDNAKLSLEAESLRMEYMGKEIKMPAMIE